jgi:catechol 2,3-dioxygenase-like lactoylglutathione lyase family enzyme
LGAICEQGNRRFRLAVLRYGQESVGAFDMNEEAAVISLVTPLGPPPTGTGIKLNQISISHFGIAVKGLDAIYQDLKSKGVTFAVPPTTTKTDAGTIHSAFVEDPDGILIELQELIPA